MLNQPNQDNDHSLYMSIVIHEYVYFILTYYFQQCHYHGINRIIHVDIPTVPDSPYVVVSVELNDSGKTRDVVLLEVPIFFSLYLSTDLMQVFTLCHFPKVLNKIREQCKVENKNDYEKDLAKVNPLLVQRMIHAEYN